MASEAQLEDSIGGELLLGGMKTGLQNVWGASSEEVVDLEALAQWAIWEETNLAMVRHIQGFTPTRNIPTEVITPRNPDGIYKLRNNSH